MKKILLIMSVVFITGAAMAQMPVHEGNVIIDPYIGIPNWGNSILFKDAVRFAESNASGLEGVSNERVVGGALSYGGRVEYMLADNFGGGIDVNYETSGAEFDADYRDTVTGVLLGNYNYKFKATKLRIMARFNYHFVQNDRVDAYTGFAAGWKNVNRSSTSDQPGFKEWEGDELFPISLRIAIGTRVYFTDNIGAMVELGAFGGALLQFGLSAKF